MYDSRLNVARTELEQHQASLLEQWHELKTLNTEDNEVI